MVTTSGLPSEEYIRHRQVPASEQETVVGHEKAIVATIISELS